MADLFGKVEHMLLHFHSHFPVNGFFVACRIFDLPLAFGGGDDRGKLDGTEVYDKVHLLEADSVEALGKLACHVDIAFAENAAGGLRNAAGGAQTGAGRLQNVGAMSAGKGLRHLAAAGIAHADKQDTKLAVRVHWHLQNRRRSCRRESIEGYITGLKRFQYWGILDTVDETPDGRPVRESLSEYTELTLPNDANSLGSLFGGKLMQYVDLAGSIAAIRHARSAVVTASVDSMTFLRPVTIGQLVILRSSVNRVFRTSMEVGVKVLVEDLRTGERDHVSSAYLTFVALDRERRKIVLPPVIPETGEEKRRYEEAGERRAHRLLQKRQEAGRI